MPLLYGLLLQVWPGGRRRYGILWFHFATALPCINNFLTNKCKDCCYGAVGLTLLFFKLLYNQFSMRYLLLVLILPLLPACGGGGDSQQSQILGTWTLTAIDGKHELQACEKFMQFTFTDEATELAGRSGWVLTVLQGEQPCDMIGPNDDYTSAYTFVDGNLFVKNIRLTGGDNWSGLMNVESFTSDELVVTSLKTTFTFKKAA